MNITKKLMMAAGLFFQLSTMHADDAAWIAAIDAFGGINNIVAKSMNPYRAISIAKNNGKNTPEALAIGFFVSNPAGTGTDTTRNKFRGMAPDDVADIIYEFNESNNLPGDGSALLTTTNIKRGEEGRRIQKSDSIEAQPSRIAKKIANAEELTNNHLSDSRNSITPTLVNVDGPNSSDLMIAKSQNFTLAFEIFNNSNSTLQQTTTNFSAVAIAVSRRIAMGLNYLSENLRNTIKDAFSTKNKNHEYEIAIKRLSAENNQLLNDLITNLSAVIAKIEDEDNKTKTTKSVIDNIKKANGKVDPAVSDQFDPATLEQQFDAVIAICNSVSVDNAERINPLVQAAAQALVDAINAIPGSELTENNSRDLIFTMAINGLNHERIHGNLSVFAQKANEAGLALSTSIYNIKDQQNKSAAMNAARAILDAQGRSQSSNSASATTASQNRSLGRLSSKKNKHTKVAKHRKAKL